MSISPHVIEWLSNAAHSIIQFGSKVWHSETAATWFAGFATLLVALVAVAQQWIHRRFWRPRLELNARVSYPDAEKTTFNGRIPVYFYRLAITNRGRSAAHEVKVYLAAVERRLDDGRLVPVEHFIPMYLKWMHTSIPTKATILPDMPPEYCDLAHITHPDLKDELGEAVSGLAPEFPVVVFRLK